MAKRLTKAERQALWISRLLAEVADLKAQVGHYRWQALKRLEGTHIQAAQGVPVSWRTGTDHAEHPVLG
jgi:hypothetical protein